jgi:hypothetical protein
MGAEANNPADEQQMQDDGQSTGTSSRLTPEHRLLFRSQAFTRETLR